MIIDRKKFISLVRVISAALLISLPKAHAQSTAATGGVGSYGDVQFTSNYVDRGISQSYAGSSFGGRFGYWFGQFGRLGLDVASVAYMDENAEFEAHIFGEYTFVFTPNTDLRIRNDWVQYFVEGKRNKSSLTLDQNFFGYHVIFSREDNFEGTRSGRDWFAFGKDWIYSPSLYFTTTIGYSMIKSSTYNNYFNALGSVTYTLNSTLTLMASASYATNSEQFGGLADPAAFATLRAKF